MNYQKLVEALTAELAGNGMAQTTCNANAGATIDMSATLARIQGRASLIESDIAAAEAIRTDMFGGSQ